MQEAVSHVEGRTAPHFQREAVVEDFRRAGCTLDHIAGTYTGGQQRLVRVAHGGIGDQQLFLIEHPVAHGFGVLGVKQLLEAGALRRRVLIGWEARNVQLTALGRRIVHLNLCDVAQHLGGAVAAGLELEQLGCFVAAMADGEIGGLVGMSRSAVQRHRTRILNELWQRLEDNGGRNAK